MYYSFRMNVMEEIFEIRSCIEILANDIKVKGKGILAKRHSSIVMQ